MRVSRVAVLALAAMAGGAIVVDGARGAPSAHPERYARPAEDAPQPRKPNNRAARRKREAERKREERESKWRK